MDDTGRNVDIVYIERDKLADPDARCVKKLKHCPVAVPFCVGARGLLKQEFDFLACKYLWKLLRRLIGNEFGSRAFFNISVCHKQTVKAFDGSDRTAHGSDGFAVAF